MGRELCYIKIIIRIILIMRKIYFSGIRNRREILEKWEKEGRISGRQFFWWLWVCAMMMMEMMWLCDWWKWCLLKLKPGIRKGKMNRRDGEKQKERGNLKGKKGEIFREKKEERRKGGIGEQEGGNLERKTKERVGEETTGRGGWNDLLFDDELCDADDEC